MTDKKSNGILEIRCDKIKIREVLYVKGKIETIKNIVLEVFII